MAAEGGPARTEKRASADREPETWELVADVRRCLRSRGVSAQELNDLVQDVMVVLISRRARVVRFGTEGLFKYARVVARGMAAKRWRRDNWRREIDDSLAAEQQPASHWSDPTDTLELQRVLGAIDSSAPACAEALVLTEVVGLTNEEAAVQLGVPLGTVKTRLRRLRQQVRRQSDDESP
jgi:RNA polymerase sigma-70 factor, ECF subfamily